VNGSDWANVNGCQDEPKNSDDWNYEEMLHNMVKVEKCMEASDIEQKVPLLTFPWNLD
jgi:hypothetical protein